MRSHAHVQRSIPRETKTARRRVELMRGNPQIEQYPVKLIHAVAWKKVDDIGKIRFHEPDPVRKASDPARCLFQRLGILIAANHRCTRSQQSQGMPSPSNRSIQKQFSWTRLKQ